VGAVKAAVAAGVAAAAKVGQVYGQLVIPRPHDEISDLIHKVDRGQPKESTSISEKSEVETPASPDTDVSQQPESPVDKRCVAITKSGERCKLPARLGSKYCNFHRKLEKTD